MHRELSEEKISKLLKKYSVPAIVGVIITIIYNIVDRIFVARGVGTMGIAGISLSLPIMTFFLAVGLLIGVGSGVLTSLSIGQKDIEKSERILGNSIALFGIWGIFSMIISQIFIVKTLEIFGASDVTMPYALEYLRYLLLGGFFLSFIPGFGNIIRAEGSPKVAMYLSVLGAGLNIILDYIFIFKFNMGLKGAALATVIAISISGISMILHFTHGSSNIKLRRKNIRIDMDITKEVLSIGMAPFIMQLSTSLIVIFLNKNLKIYGGDIAIAAYGIINSLILLIRMPIVGMQQGSQAIISFNYGAKAYGRVRETYLLCIKIAFIISGTGFILAMFIPGILASAFVKNDPELMGVTVNGIRIFFAFVFLQGFNTISSMTFMAMKKASISSKLNSLHQFGLTIPLIFILPKFLGIDGIWLATPLAELIFTIVIAPLIYKEMRELKSANVQVEV